MASAAPAASAANKPSSRTPPAAAGGAPSTAPPAPAPPPGRRAFTSGGQTVYEWEQTLEDVLVYITPPPGVKASHLFVKIAPGHVSLGLKGAPPFIDERLAGTCVAGESLWTFDDGVLQVQLTKAHRAETWPSVFVGHGELDAAAQAAVHKALLLERFQQEHPGFDFSGADVNGAVPDPRTFMGGPGAPPV